MNESTEVRPVPIPPPDPQSASQPVRKHGIDELAVPVRVRLGPLIVIVETIRPDVTAAAVDDRRRAVPRPQQRRGRGPVVGGAPRVEALRLPDAERVGDLVERRALVHVRPVGAEADVAVEVAVGRRHAGHVLHGDGLVRARRQPVVPGHGQVHGVLDAAVGVCLVLGRVRDSLELPGDGRRGERGIQQPERREELATHNVKLRRGSSSQARDHVSKKHRGDILHGEKAAFL